MKLKIVFVGDTSLTYTNPNEVYFVGQSNQIGFCYKDIVGKHVINMRHVKYIQPIES